MRVLIVHNEYQQPGGEDAMASAEARLLRDAGVDVERLTLTNDDVELGGKLRLAVGATWNVDGCRRVARAVRQGRFDVVHFHNVMVRFSPAAIRSARAAGSATVLTLHNFRTICPKATLFRDGHVCSACVGKTLPMPAIRHACYRGSRPATAALAMSHAVHHLAGTWIRHVDAFITHTAGTRDWFVRGGLPAEKLHVKPNFVHPIADAAPTLGEGVVYVGRLAAEKGVATLLDAAPNIRGTVTIVGDGPMADDVRKLSITMPHVTWLGQRDADGVRHALHKAAVALVPSVWHEMYPLTILEAFAAGRPVVASDMGSMRDMVTDGITGRLVPPGDPVALADAANQLLAESSEAVEFGAAGRRWLIEHHSADAQTRRLRQVYDAALVGRHFTATSEHTDVAAVNRATASS
ncbi:MAG: glycosyltransferase family 4 protein [Planctomycetota bacterium]